MVALLGLSAIAIDAGVLYAERAQLQSGADAGALGVAQNCASTPTSADCSPSSPLAADLANQNSLDGLSNIQSVAFSTPPNTGGKVTVTTGAQESGGEANRVSFFVADVIGIPTARVGATASAAWGSPVAGPAAFPIAVSICQVRDQSGVMQLLQLHGNNANPDCNYGPSGQAVEGGFGGLAEDSPCSALIDTTTLESGSDVGNNPPSNCQDLLNSWALDLSAGRKVTVLLPVFNQVTGTGSGAIYGIKTFAAFEVAGWKLGTPGLPYTFRNRAPDVPVALECREPCRGIIGTFVEYVSLDTSFTMGALDPDGVTIIGMTD